MNKLVLALLAVAACLLLLAGEHPAGGALARRDDDDDVSDRAIEIEVDGDEVEVEGLAPDGSDRVEFEMELKSSDSHLFDSEFRWKTGNNETEQQLTLKLRLLSVVEYAEAGTTPGFQGGEDTVVATYGGDAGFGDASNTDAAWDAFQTLPDQAVGAATVKSFQASTADGVLTVRGKISTQATTGVGLGVALDPNSMKIDVEISNYPEKQDDTFLALVCRLKAESQVGEDDDDDDDRVVFKGTEALPVAAFFGWEPTLTVDGSVVNVVASGLVNKGSDDEGIEYEIVFAFPAAGDEYSWDPTTGITYQADSGAASALKPFYYALF